jgi:hypothetical protein
VQGTRSPLVRQRVGYHIVGVFKETASGAKNDPVERSQRPSAGLSFDLSATGMSARWDNQNGAEQLFGVRRLIGPDAHAP